jgi:hypothetical protein
MASTALVTGVLTTTAATVFNGGFASNAASTALSNIFWQGKNSVGSTKDYMKVRSYILDVTDGTEDFGMDIQVMTGGNVINALDILPTELVINNGGIDRDFRVESDSSTHALFVDGSNGNVGIGTSSPAYKIDSRVSTSASIVAGLNLDASGNSNGDGSAITFSRVGNILSGLAKISAVKAEVSNNETDLVFSNYAAGSLTEKMRIIGASGNVGINTSSPSTKLTVDAAATISATDYYVASTWTAALRGSGVNSKAGLLLNSYSASGQSALASIHSEPVADYRAALVATYSADGSGAGYFAVNQFRPAY